MIVVADPATPRLWARFYTLDTGRPLFAGRDGQPHATLAEIERERRTGYAWYVQEPEDFLSRDWPRWQRGAAALSLSPEPSP